MVKIQCRYGTTLQTEALKKVKNQRLQRMNAYSKSLHHACISCMKELKEVKVLATINQPLSNVYYMGETSIMIFIYVIIYKKRNRILVYKE